MQRMGMNMDAVADVQQVIIRTANKDIVIDEPEVAILQVQGQKMYQVIGGKSASKPHHSEERQRMRRHYSPKKTYSWWQIKLAKAWKKQKKPSKNAAAT